MEIQFRIFKFLDRPSKLSLGLTGPDFLSLLGTYYDLGRYKRDVKVWNKIGFPEGVSWGDSATQPTIIRWVGIIGGDDIDDPPQGSEGRRQKIFSCTSIGQHTSWDGIVVDPDARLHTFAS